MLDKFIYINETLKRNASVACMPPPANMSPENLPFYNFTTILRESFKPMLEKVFAKFPKIHKNNEFCKHFCATLFGAHQSTYMQNFRSISQHITKIWRKQVFL